jgi:DNA invertase Pin-like site-specific DNA recombinase
MFTASKGNRNHVGKTCGNKRLAKAPSPRDMRAFELAAQGLSQREAARVLGCSQSTVLRGIARTTKWIASQDPDRQGERTWLERFRVATARHLILLEHESRMPENRAS